jgi:uncharacterized protein (DUF1330 family)
MAVYAVIIKEGPTSNQAEYDEYLRKLSVNRGDHAIEPLAMYGETVALEGEGAEGVVILKFADMDAAKAWYYSPEYQDAVPHRLKSAKFRSFLVQGM